MYLPVFYVYVQEIHKKYSSPKDHSVTISLSVLDVILYAILFTMSFFKHWDVEKEGEDKSNMMSVICGKWMLRGVEKRWASRRSSAAIDYFRKHLHGENYMAIFTTLSVVIGFSTGTLGIFATLVYVFTMHWVWQ